VKRGRSTVFCRAEVRTAAGVLAAVGTLVYKVGSKPVPIPGA
jgi:acyl-coenzyme A thioesterase PaaI-like protein